MRPPLLHITSQIFDQPLMIVPEKLESLLIAFGPRFGLTDSSLDSLLSVERRAYDQRLSRYLQPGKDGLSADIDFADDDDQPDRKPYKITSTGIAVIPISGVLMKRGGWMTSLSGCSSYEMIGKALKCALADDAVRGILFDVDSPGGTTHGCFELSDLIFESRSEKEIRAVSNDLAASAAYALASSASHLYVTRTGAVGSVGVFALHCDQSVADEKVGVKFTYIYAGDKKIDGNPHEPLARSAKKDIQAEVDREYGIFVATVARNRDKLATAISATEAGVEYASESVPLLADEVCSFDEAIAEFSSDLDRLSKRSRVSMRTEKSKSLSGDVSSESKTDRSTAETAEGDSKMAKKADSDYMPKKGRKAEDADESEDSKKGKKAEDADDADDAEAAKADDADEADDADAKKAEDADDADDADAKKAKTDPEEPDDDDEPEKKPSGKKSKRADVTPLPVAASGQSAAHQISELCMIAGFPEKAPTYILKEFTVAQVRKLLLDKRAKISAETSVSGSFGSPVGVKATTLHSIAHQAAQVVAQSGVKTQIEKATLMARTIEAGLTPEIYEAYQQEREIAMESKRGSIEYVRQMESVMATMGLSRTR